MVVFGGDIKTALYFVCVCVRARARVRACVRMYVCVRVCECQCMCACVCNEQTLSARLNASVALLYFVIVNIVNNCRSYDSCEKRALYKCKLLLIDFFFFK